MALEIERKFLLKPGAQLPESDMVLNIQQAYIANDSGLSVRIRLINLEEAYLTIKKAKSETLGVRSEFEYEIPVEDAIEMMQLNHYVKVVKQRHIVMDGGRKWEVDFFLEDNEGLIIAELELPSLEETIVIPDWIGKEVTDDPRYLNNHLAVHPYNTWNEQL